MSEHYWILDPEGHRRLQNAQAAGAPDTPEFFGEQIQVFHVTAPPDVWVCDRCNSDIYTRHKLTREDLTVCRCGRTQCPLVGEALPVPALGGSVYCRSCFEEQDGYDTWPRHISCACSACIVQAQAWGYPVGERDGA